MLLVKVIVTDHGLHLFHTLIYFYSSYLIFYFNPLSQLMTYDDDMSGTLDRFEFAKVPRN